MFTWCWFNVGPNVVTGAGWCNFANSGSTLKQNGVIIHSSVYWVAQLIFCHSKLIALYITAKVLPVIIFIY